MLVNSYGEIKSNTIHSDQYVCFERRNDPDGYTHDVKELNKDFKNYSRIDGREFVNVLDIETEVAYRLIYLRTQSVLFTIAI